MKPEKVISSQNNLGESPLWDYRVNALYWVDIEGRKILQFFPDSKKVEIFPTPMRVSALGLREKGGMVCAADEGFHFWDPQTNTFEFICHPEQGKEVSRFNDGHVDRQGRFWAGTMTPKGASSSLYRLDADLSIHRMESGVTISNGIGWSLDNNLMYFTDSARKTIFLYDFDAPSGEIGNKRVFFRLEGAGVPDGLSIDAEGCIWSAIYDGWKILRIDPNGSVMQEIIFPVSRPSSCAFGGRDLQTLYATSISEGLQIAELEQQPLSGDLFQVTNAAAGLREPMFAG